MRRIAHTVALAGLSAAALGLLAVPASAHVTVSPATAAKGAYATLTFKVPNERPEATTTTIEVEFPEAYPLASVSVQPKPGWGYEIERANLPTPLSSEGGEQITQRVAKITWTADGTGTQIKPGEFETFPVSAGPLPANASSLVFKALQTYSNSEIVRWIEEASPGSAEPRFPAPKLALTDAAPESTGTTVTAPSASGDASAAVNEAKAAAEEAKRAVAEVNAALASSTSSTAADGPTKNQVNTAVGLAIGAIVLALIGAGIGGAALARRPNDDDPPPPVNPASPPPAF